MSTILRLNQIPAAVKKFGLLGTINLLISRRKLRRVLPATSTLKVKGHPYRFRFRRVSTDKNVIVEVLLLNQYECLRTLPDVRTIIDAGANVGATSVYLLDAYPEATVIAFEPDPDNFAVLRENLARYGARASVRRQALWHRPEPLVIDRGHFRDGGEWSTQVKPGGPADRSDVQGVTLSQVIHEHQLDVIDILKIDIEGAERYVLDSLSSCLDRVRTLAIELHDPEGRAIFARVIAAWPGRVSRHGEVTLWQRAAPEVPPD